MPPQGIRTKIVCTIGPACRDEETLYKMVRAGMDVARFNFSHGSHGEHKEAIERVRRASSRAGRRVGIMLDTRGPEIRLGSFENGKALLRAGSTFTLFTSPILGDAARASVSYDRLPALLSTGDHVLLGDGNVQLEVRSTGSDRVITTVLNDGPVSDRKKVSVPGIRVDLPAVDAKDARDIAFGASLGVDYVAASFVRKPEDVLRVRKELDKHRSKAKTIAKVESREGVDNLEGILEVADGLMVARGDLGVELPPEDIPIIQKRMISAALRIGKPVITATQMLESMTERPRPTRAEASDVANAILDGTDAVMLSGETASGKYPVESVEFMARIAKRTEESLSPDAFLRLEDGLGAAGVTEAVSRSAVETAMKLEADAIVTPTESGYTARAIARFRPPVPVFAVTPHEETCGWLTLVWGVLPLLDTTVEDESVRALDALRSQGFLSAGDLCIVTKGVPFGVSGTTNSMEVRRVPVQAVRE